MSQFELEIDVFALTYHNEINGNRITTPSVFSLVP